MTELEQHIYDTIKDRLPELNEKFAGMILEGERVEVPFVCDDVVDSLVFGVPEKRFIKIRYAVGVGDGLAIDVMPPTVAYYNDVCHREFEI